MRKPVGIPNASADNQQAALQRVIEVVNGLQGARTVGERAVRFEDLIEAGLVGFDQNGDLVVSAGTGSIQQPALDLKANAANPMLSGGITMANVSSAPTTPIGGGVMYVEAGALKYKNTAGTVTVLGAAPASGTGLTITWNPADKHADIGLSNGNLDATNTPGGAWRTGRGHALHTLLKSYFEIPVVAGTTIMGGICDNTHDLAAHLGNTTGGTGGHGYALLTSDGSKLFGGSGAACLPAFGTSDVLQISFDPVSRKLWFGRNNTWVGDPAAGTGEAFIVTAGYTYYPGFSGYYVSNSGRLRALASNQAYAPPSGFVPAAG